MRNLSHRESLRGEYQALVSYFGTVITFRFTTASFYIAAIGLIFSANNIQSSTYLLVAFVTIAVWILELRNRAIFRRLIARGTEIECQLGITTPNSFGLMAMQRPFDSHRYFLRIGVPGDRILSPQYFSTSMFWFRDTLFMAKYISHTAGLDLLFLTVLGLSVWRVVNVDALGSVGWAQLGGATLLAFGALMAWCVGFKKRTSESIVNGSTVRESSWEWNNQLAVLIGLLTAILGLAIMCKNG